MCLYGLSQGDQSTALPKTSCCCSTTRIRTVPMCASSAWLSCEPCDVRVGMYIVFAYGIEHASMGRYCGDYAQAPRVLIVGRKMVRCVSHLWRLVLVIGIHRYYCRSRIPS